MLPPSSRIEMCRFIPPFRESVRLIINIALYPSIHQFIRSFMDPWLNSLLNLGILTMYIYIVVTLLIRGLAVYIRHIYTTYACAIYTAR
jgi:hypothetical protein